jgi:hypothetical protein
MAGANLCRCASDRVPHAVHDGYPRCGPVPRNRQGTDPSKNFRVQPGTVGSSGRFRKRFLYFMATLWGCISSLFFQIFETGILNVFKPDILSI